MLWLPLYAGQCLVNLKNSSKFFEKTSDLQIFYQFFETYWPTFSLGWFLFPCLGTNSHPENSSHKNEKVFHSERQSMRYADGTQGHREEIYEMRKPLCSTNCLSISDVADHPIGCWMEAKNWPLVNLCYSPVNHPAVTHERSHRHAAFNPILAGPALM